MKNQFKIVVIIAFLLFSFKGLLAQEGLNDYKYVIVAEQFSCQKSPNLYRLNELTKFLLKKQNFNVFLASETLPEDLAKNNCLALLVDVIENNSMFKTKLKLVFKDCRNKVIYATEEGISREKEYKVAFNFALRASAKTLASFKHNYDPNNSNIEVDQVKPEPKPEVNKETDNQVPKKVVKPESKKKAALATENKTTTSSLKAELIPGSVFNYELKNDKSETVYTILFSGKEDLYMVKGQEAVIYKMNNRWMMAIYKGKDLEVQTLDIQF